jgi:type I restriction enzyme S subunit
LILKNDLARKDFLYWLLRTRGYQSFIVSSATGTTVRHTSPSRIYEFKFTLPPLTTQTDIAEILSSLDDKIELNNQINRELEALAQALFNQWFVDFEFTDENGVPYQSSGGEMVASELGEIPLGWKVGTLDEVLDIKYGKDYEKLEDGTIPVYGSGGIMRYANKYLYDKISILIPRKGTLSNLFYIEEPFWSVDTMFYTKFITLNMRSIFSI